MHRGSRQIRFQWLLGGLIAATIAVGFGAMLPDFYMGSDDLFETGIMRHVSREGTAGILERFGTVLCTVEGAGHFRPAQDVVFVTLFRLLGPHRWALGAMLVYAACHLLAACLIATILRRLRAPTMLAIAAALLFAAHPVLDENLAAATLGNHLPGMACVLGACLFFLPKPPAERSTGVRIALGGALLFVAIGFGIDLLAAGAIVLGYLTLAIFAEDRSARDLGKRVAAIAIAAGVSMVHRQLVNGTIGSRIPLYNALGPGLDAGPFVREVFDGAVLLHPSPTTTWIEARNPIGLSWDDGSAPLVSWDSVIVVLGSVGLATLAFVLSRRVVPPPGDERAAPRRLAPAFVFGAVLAVAAILPYRLFLGRVGLHRYLFPAIPGLVIMGTTAAFAAGRVLERFVPSRIVAALGIAILAAQLGAYLRTDRETARSIAAAHRSTRAIIGAITRDLSADPDAKEVLIVGHPRVIGRAGYGIVFGVHLRGVVGAGGFLEAGDADDVVSGRLEFPQGPGGRLYLVEPDGFQVRRIPAGHEAELPVYARKEVLQSLRSQWRLDDDEMAIAALQARHPSVVQSAAGVLAELEDWRRRSLFAEALDRGPISPALLRAALGAARRGDLEARTLASKVAVLAEPGDDAERDALAILAGGGTPDAARKAAESERRARALARDPARAGEALAAFEASRAAWKAEGVPRGDLSADLVGALDAFEKGRRMATIDGVSIRLAWTRPPWKLGSWIVTATIGNRSGLHLAGGVAPAAARISWTWRTASGDVDAGEQWLPARGIPPGETRAVRWVVSAPAQAKTLHAALFWLGKERAAAELPAP